ncbi:hypothetical protein F511_02049 [Dorcoceras hygrometricum]|uniref:Uncharacterized protein n=1 Tax=Dorcoceras hygrometricum TaxID=472368 RepID=A0A2Z7BZ91_9LAMI|nr:hypothetical protein F511_02049 [Dorcoceras hygrometricum]
MNQAIDIEEGLLNSQSWVQPSVGQSFYLAPSGTPSSKPSQAPQSLNCQRFSPRGKQFKRLGSSSSGLDSSGGASSRAVICGQCGGRHLTSQCHGVHGACRVWASWTLLRGVHVTSTKPSPAHDYRGTYTQSSSLSHKYSGTSRCILLITELPICDDRSSNVRVYPIFQAYPEVYPPWYLT